MFGKTSYNRPSRFICEIDDELLQYQGLARPANSSFGVRYSNSSDEQLTFGQGMSLQQALQARKAKVQPTSSRGAQPFSKAGKAVPVGQSASASKEAVDWQIATLLTIKMG